MDFEAFSSVNWRAGPWRWLPAVIAMAVATAIRLVFDPALPDGFPFLTYLPAALMVAMVSGMWPAMFAALGGLIISWYFFVIPRNSFAIAAPEATALLLYILACAVGIAVVERLGRLTLRLSAERDRNAILAAAQIQSAQEVWESRERLTTLIRQLPVGIVETDLSGRLLLTNDRAATLLGRPPADLADTTMADLVHIADRADLDVFFQRLIDGENGLEFALRETAGARPALVLHGSVTRDAEQQTQSLLLAIEPLLNSGSRSAHPMERRAVPLKPVAASRAMRIEAAEKRVKIGPVVGMNEVRNFVGDDIAAHESRGEDQPPAIGDAAARAATGGATAPARAGITNADLSDWTIDRSGKPLGAGGHVGERFGPEPPQSPRRH
jgi:PAS domain S-box-containing protein